MNQEKTMKKRLMTFLVLIAGGCGPGVTDAPEPTQVEEAYPGAVGETRTGLFETSHGLEELSYRWLQGKAVFQGDIILPLTEQDPSALPVRAQGAGQTLGSFRWPNRTIPYVIDANMTDRARISDAIAHWEASSAMRFVPRTDQLDYVRFVEGASGSGCYSAVGRMGFEQIINLESTCGKGAVIHEIGHAVGLWHEQTRADRDAHVMVNLSNVTPADKVSNFNRYSSGEDYGIYDFRSVMHYGSFAFSDDVSPLPTIVRQDGSTFDAQRDGLSVLDRRAVSEMYSESFGRTVVTGNFNNDGFMDLAVAAPRRSPLSCGPKSGVVTIYFGSPSGLVFRQEIGQALLDTDEEPDRFGTSLAAGDFDGDGRDDLAVGAPRESVGSASQTGLVYLYRGTSSGVSAWQTLTQAGIGATESGDLFGTALAAGDFDNDGRDDLAVGAPGESPGSFPRSGSVFVYRGTSTGLSPWQGLQQNDTEEAGDSFGAALAAGDFDGDGRVDLAVGAPHEITGSASSGVVYVSRGGVSGFTPLVTLGEGSLAADDDLFGSALATGDFDNDGRDDLAVGAPGRSEGGNKQAGRVFLFRGTAAGPQAHSSFTQAGLGMDEQFDGFGYALAFGDFDNDGRDDLAAGAPGESPGSSPSSGVTFVFHGTATGLAPWTSFGQTLWADEAGDFSGAALAAGDFNADGLDDLAMGAPGEVQGQYGHTGMVFIYRGTASGPVASTALGPQRTVTIDPPALTADPPALTVDPPALSATPASMTVTPPSFSAQPPSMTVNGFTFTPPPVTVSPPPMTVAVPAVRVDPPAFTVDPPPFTIDPPAITVPRLSDADPIVFNPPPITATPPSLTVTPASITVRPPSFSVTPPSVTVQPPSATFMGVTVTPPPFMVTPPPVTVSPPPLTVTVPPMTVTPPPVTVDPPPITIDPC
jgi:astacin (peptidase family M12A)/FG-GAP repeat protein